MEQTVISREGTFLTKSDVARIMKCSVKTVENMMKKGLKYIKIGRTVRVKSTDLDCYLKQYTVEL